MIKEFLMSRTRIGILLISLTAMVPFCSGCEDKTIISARCDRSLVVDGEDGDWTGVDLYSIEEPQLAVGVLNDDQNLYLMVKTYDRALAQTMVQRGLTVWFDPEAQNKQVFGVRFPMMPGLPKLPSGIPIGVEPESDPPQGISEGEWRGGRQRGKPENFSAAKIDTILSRSRQLEVLGFDKEDCRVLDLDHAESLGVAVRCSYGHGLLTYEVRVLLRTDQQHRYGIGLAVYDSIEYISLGLVAGGGMSREMQGKRPPIGGMGMPGGRPGGMMGGPPGGPGGLGGHGGGDKPQELEYWTKVALPIKVR
jgi:hypothetical protein